MENKKIQNIIICGLGAIGTAIGEKILHNFSGNLHVLVDNERLIKYQNSPRILNGKELLFEYITPDVADYRADLIIIAVKSMALNEVINNIKNFVDENTIIISLLNGVTSEENLAKVYSWKNILPAYYIGSSAMRNEGAITHDGRATIVYGAKNETQAPLVTSVKCFFEQACINYKISTDIDRALWSKFMLNVACNQISAILGLTFGDMQTNQYFKNLAFKVMKEVELCAKAEGIKNTDTMISEVFEHIKTTSPDGKTSMLQDIEAGRQTEVDIFAGSVITFGKKHGIATPYNETLELMIKTISEKQMGKSH